MCPKGLFTLTASSLCLEARSAFPCISSTFNITLLNPHGKDTRFLFAPKIWGVVTGRPYTVRTEAASFVKGVYAVDPGPPGGPGGTKLIPLQRRLTITRRKDAPKDTAAPVELTSVPIASSRLPAESGEAAPYQGTKTLVLDSIPIAAPLPDPLSPSSTFSPSTSKASPHTIPVIAQRSSSIAEGYWFPSSNFHFFPFCCVHW